MSEIANWLRSQGLDKYIEVFEENDIEPDVLSELTEQDLQELGLSLGHRKKFIKAVNDLKTAATPPPEPEDEVIVPGATEAEKRFLTIVFCDLANSTRIAAALDLEDTHLLNRTYQATCDRIIRKHTGVIGKFLGDGVLAYFGFPSVQEDDAERAIKASMEIIDEVTQLNQMFPLPGELEIAVRVGIATGPVVIETIGDEWNRENAVVGEAPNLAARFQDLGSKNSIIIGSDTRKLVENRFDMLSLGKKSIKGYASELEIWEITGEKSARDTLLSSQKNHLTPLIGRDEELGLLRSRWTRAISGEGQVVLLSGEAGIGKSRLIESLLDSLQGDPAIVRLFCSPSATQSPLFPFWQEISDEAGIAPGDNRTEASARLASFLKSDYDMDDGMVATALSLANVEYLENDGGHDPQRQLQRIQESIASHFVSLCEDNPLLVIVEDAHWIDASSQKVVEMISERIPSLPVMLLVSHRTEKPMSYPLTHVTTLSLSNLSRGQSERLIEEILAKTGLGQDTVNRINRKSAGVPLYLEEITKSIMESQEGAEAKGDSEVIIPDSLQASLLSKLDRLGEARLLAQCGSVIGNTFRKSLVENISSIPSDAFDQNLERLISSNITVRAGGGDDFDLMFRHALLRDAAYDSMLKQNRRDIHRATAEFLESQDEEEGVRDHNIIAYHYERGEVMGSAFRHWLAAGRTAMDSGATVEASELLDRANNLLNLIPPDQRSGLEEFHLHMYRGQALNASRGAASEEAHQCFRNAVAVAKKLGDLEKQIDALDYLFGIVFNSGNIRGSLKPADEMLQIGEEQDNLFAKISGHQVLGMAYCSLGETDKANYHLEAALDTKGQEITGINSYPSMTLDYLSFVKYFMGEEETARNLCERAIRSAREEEESVYSTASALSNSCFTLAMLGDFDQVNVYSEDLVEVAEKLGQYMYLNRGKFFINLVKARSEHSTDALRKAEESLGRLLESKEFIDTTYLIGMIAELQIELGRLDDAGDSLTQAINIARSNEELFYLAELQRLNGLLHRAQGKEDTARELLEEALETARSQGASGWEKRILETMERS